MASTVPDWDRQIKAMSTARQPDPATSQPHPHENHTSRRQLPANFGSVLFGDPVAEVDGIEQPAYFTDLNLDQVVRAVINRRERYDLAPFFGAAQRDLDTIEYRQEVFGDLERPALHQAATAFAAQELVARHEAQHRSMQADDGGFAHHHRTRVFLNNVVAYCDAVEQLAKSLHSDEVHARGLLGLRDYLARYIGSEPFRALRDEARSLDRELDQIRYSFLLDGSRITVGPYDDQPDYSAEVVATFDRFRQTEAADRRQEAKDWDDYAAIGVLHLVAKVHPATFARLDAFCVRHVDYLDSVLARFDRELQFYLGYLEYIAPLRRAGLHFSYPRMSTDDKSEQALETFDLALAAKLAAGGDQVVCNDVRLEANERMIVITGPNNGGKTTLARAIGQLHHLARLGCPVPGRDTRLFLCDRIFTRFERREDIATMSGKLQDELNRLHEALNLATPESLFILNEMFNSTTAHDALWLSRQILARLGELGALCVCVTFLDELATLDDTVVSMVSTVDLADPAIRTYKVLRRPADGRAYARAVAEKYGLTHAQLSEERHT
jgi:DNA mismatch repair protein MutS